MKIKDLFASDVTRDIAPVVYFHEQSPAKLEAEVGEYIVTGGFPEDHPGYKRVPDGIHEQYVHLLRAIVEELGRSGGPDLPSSWISGFYGSGKSIFAKLLGLALDGVALPNGKSLSEALLTRDTSPNSQEFRDAWHELRKMIDPIAVVFDVGGLARDNEHIHSVCVRQVQTRLGYCTTQPLVAEFELNLERDGRWSDFEAKAVEVLGKPWAEVKNLALAEDDFSAVMHALVPDRYTDPMSWFQARAGTVVQFSAAADATKAIADMLDFRAEGKTLFIVVDEVSQYIHQDQQRMLKLQSFVSELGQRLKGKAWLLVTGQQKLEEADDTHVLSKLKDRFKPKLRVHLAATNIRDVVHKRLLQKTPEAEKQLRELFRKHRNDLKLFAYGCEDITEEDFVEVYPLLPGHIALLLQITTALRIRSSRSQGDDQAIRGLLQLLGELFRGQQLAEMPVGRLVTLDQIFEVQHSALDSDVQNTLVRVLDYCTKNDLPLAARAAKAVALLELIQDVIPTDANFVARSLFDELNCGNQEEQITAALEELRRVNLLSYSEKQGYKVQSSSGEEWENDRRNIPIGRDDLVGHIQEALKYLLIEPARPKLQGRAFPWMAYFSDSQRAENVLLLDPRETANITVDIQMLSVADRDAAIWVNRSDEGAYRTRMFWVADDATELETKARDYGRSLAMVNRWRPRRESLTNDKKHLLLQEEADSEELERHLRAAVDAAWTGGTIYFRGRATPAVQFGAAFAAVLADAGKRFLPELYSSFLATQLSPAEVMQLLEPTLTAPSPKYLEDELGILKLDAGRYVPSCEGVAPVRVMEFIEQEQAVGGDLLLKWFGSPPHGYTNSVVQACVAGLLRASRLRIEPEGGQVLTAPRDAGAREIFEKDRDFRRASFFPAQEGAVGAMDINRICNFFHVRLSQNLDHATSDIADAVSQCFPAQAQRLRDVLGRLKQLPPPAGEPAHTPHALVQLEKAIEACVRVVRQTEPTLQAVKRNLDDLNDGFEQLSIYDAELTVPVVQAVRAAADVVDYQLTQLEQLGGQNGELESAAGQIRSQLQSEKPWRDLAGIASHLETVRAIYVEERLGVLTKNGEREEAARVQIKAREGFATLTADQSHHVLRPIAEALPTTSEEAVSPRLVELRDGADHALGKAAEIANERLDQILGEGKEPPVRKVALGLRNREIKSQPELDALIENIRDKVEPELRAGRRVRLVD